MTDDTALLHRLERYLEVAANDQITRDRERQETHDRIAMLVNQALKTDHRIEVGFADVRTDLRLIKAEQVHMGQRIEALEDAQEVTGVTRVDELQRRLDSERAKARGLSRVALGIAAALVVALLTAGTALAVKALSWGSAKQTRAGEQ